MSEVSETWIRKVREAGTFGLTEESVALPAAPVAGRWSLEGLGGRVRAVRVQLLVLLGFLGLAVLLLGPVWTAPATRTLGGGVGDPGLFAWFLRWTPFAAGRHISPFASDYLNHPDGINLMWNTWMPLPGLLLSPITLLFGPVLAFNLLVTLAYGLSAWSAYLAIHRYVPSHGAAACGGLVYGFSPAMVGHSHHPNLTLILLLPWLFVLLDEILDRQRRSPVWLGVGLGLVAAAQLLTGAEVFAGMVLLGLVMLVLLLVANRHALRERGRGLYAATALAVSVVVFELLVAWPLRAQIAGPARVHADVTEEVRGSSDLLALVTPSRVSAIAPEAALRLGERFTGTMETYLGIPLLLVVVLVASRRRSPVVRVASAMLLVSLVLSLGSRLRVGGLVTPVPLPWTVVESLPVWWHMVPARLALFTALFAGLLLAVALEDLWGGGRRERVLAVVTARVGRGVQVPSAPRPAPPVGTPAVLTNPPVTTLPRDGVTLVVPFPRKGRDNQAMLWQARAGMWFKMPGGYFVGPGPDGGTLREAPPTTTARALDRIRRGGRPPALTPALRRRIAADLERWRVASVVLGPMPHRPAMAGFLTDLLGRPPERLAGVALWRDATVA